jgi:hypothetical protein
MKTIILSIIVAFSALILTINSMAEVVSIKLAEGWNLISLPVLQSDLNVQSVFSSIEGRYDAIYSYDSQDADYKAYMPGDSSNTLKNVEAGRGYWIYMNSPADLTLQGNVSTLPVELVEGWNLTGLNSITTLSITDALKSVEGSISSLYAYRTALGRYLSFVPPDTDEIKEMIPGEGYWIYATSAMSWTLSQKSSQGEKVIFEVDLTKGSAGSGTVTGGTWDNGWRVTNNNQRIVWDAGYNITNGYFEVTFTQKGEAVNLGGLKVDWVGIFQSKAISQNVDCGDVFYLRTGAPNFRFSQIKVFPTNKDGTGAKATTCRINEWIQSWGEVSDWKTDDRTVMKVKLEWKNGEAYVHDTLGKVATCMAGRCMKEVNKLRYAYVGGDTYSDLSLKGLRITRIKLVDYDGGKR